MTLLKVAVLGVGNRAQAHLQTIRCLADLCQLVGVCDANPDRVSVVAKQLNVPGFTRLERLLTEVAPDLLYVIIPADGHRAAVEIAARHGVHVISETPIAPTLPLADAMIVSAQRYGVKLEVAENVWRWPSERLKLKIIQAGLIGQVTQVHLWYHSGSYHGMSTVRQLVGRPPIRACGFARETPVPPHRNAAGALLTSGPYELGLVEFAGGAVCVYQYPVYHYRRNYWDAIGDAGAIIGTELVMVHDGARQTYPIRQTIDSSSGTPTLERVYVETDPPIVWENPLRAFPIGSGADDVARADILVTTRRAIQEGGDVAYGATNARTDQEILIAIRESALHDGSWVDLPLSGITEAERHLHDEYRRRYGHDPLTPAAEALSVLYPQVGLPQAPRGPAEHG